MGLHPVTFRSNQNYRFMSGVYDAKSKKASSSCEKNLPFFGGRKKARVGSGLSCFELTGCLGAGAGKCGQGLGEVHLSYAGGYNLSANIDKNQRSISFAFFDEVLQQGLG